MFENNLKVEIPNDKRIRKDSVVLSQGAVSKQIKNIGGKNYDLEPMDSEY